MAQFFGTSRCPTLSSKVAPRMVFPITSCKDEVVKIGHAPEKITQIKNNGLDRTPQLLNKEIAT